MVNIKSLVLTLLAFMVGGCASLSNELGSSAWTSNAPGQPDLLREVVAYPHSVPVNERISFAELKRITPQMREAVQALFPNRDAVLDITAADRLAEWIIDPDGLGVVYDVNANLTPAQVFEEKRANCLSFTLFLRALAAEIDIKIQINEVDIPANWGMNYEQNLVFYRHVNGIRLRGPRRQIFDLALDQFRFDYPQRRISESHAYAQLMSNRAIDAFRAEDYIRANHLIKLAIAEYTEDPNLWVNYGVFNERLGDPNKAMAIYLHALKIDDSTLVAITNLARVYEQFGRLKESSILQRRATEIRQQNPYHHYFLAKEYLEQGDSRLARRHINKALSMYNEDARFYELRSRTWQLSQRHAKALQDMLKAYELAQHSDERFHFKNKAAFIAQQANREFKEKRARNVQTMLEWSRTF